MERNLPPAAEHYITIKGNKQRQEGGPSSAGTGSLAQLSRQDQECSAGALLPMGLDSRVAQPEQASEPATVPASAQILLEEMDEEAGSKWGGGCYLNPRHRS